MMSFPVSVTNIIFDSSHEKTPNTKNLTPTSEQNRYVVYNPPILMDKSGQTPDHIYLARKTPMFFKVKRKLDLQSKTLNSGDGILKTTTRKRKMKTIPKAKKVSKARYDTSLGQLTKKFLKFMSVAVGNVINLNTACTLLSTPKRRLYDITNVLEGAGFIQRTSRNNVQWKGQASISAFGGMYDLEKEIDILEAEENKLDELTCFMQSELQALKESEKDYLYIMSDELKKIGEFTDKTLIGVKLGSGEHVIESSDDKVILSSKTTELAAFSISEAVSFADILHTRHEFKENSYTVQIRNNHQAGYIKDEKELEKSNYAQKNESLVAQLCSEGTTSEGFITVSSLQTASRWNEGHFFKNAFIADEDDISPLSRNFLFQTEDQNFEPAFPNLKLEDDYFLSLDDGEGLSDLFDSHF